MEIILRKAQKSKSKLRIGIAGPSGSGKTYSALKLARGLASSWDKIAVIDTENGSADLYSNLGAYNVITLVAPFGPSRYMEAIKACETAGMEVIIIDSISHEWDGTGGCLETVEKLTQQSTHKNSYIIWGKVTPIHNKFIQTILQSTCHVITTVRKKQDFDMVKNDKGRVEVVKVGLKDITREGLDYELTLAFDLTITHQAKASKDRTGLFMDKEEFMVSEDTGKALLNWANSETDKPKTDLIFNAKTHE